MFPEHFIHTVNALPTFMVICFHPIPSLAMDCLKERLSYTVLCSNRWQTFRWSVCIELIWILKSKPNISVFRISICIHLNLTQTIGLSLAGKMNILSMTIDVILGLMVWHISIHSPRLSIIYMEKKRKPSLCACFKHFTCIN